MFLLNPPGKELLPSAPFVTEVHQTRRLSTLRQTLPRMIIRTADGHHSQQAHLETKNALFTNRVNAL